ESQTAPEDYGSCWHGDLIAMMSEDYALYTGKTGSEPRDVTVRPAQASVASQPAATATSGATVSENLVTVSIPYYRCKPYIRKVVESILDQTHWELQLIVVNDGDDQPPWAELAHISDPRLVQFDLRANHGRYFADAVVLNAVDSPYFAVQ